jgi:hypothetical protein
MVEKNQIWRIDGKRVCVLLAEEIEVANRKFEIVSFRFIDPLGTVRITTKDAFVGVAINTGLINPNEDVTIIRTGNSAWDD